MQVRVFKSQDDYSDFEFGVMPKVEQEVHFADGSKFAVRRVGYVQDEGQFMAAIWLGSRPRRQDLRDIEL
jgi:hypothetical protein